VDEGRWLKRLARGLAGQPLGGEAAKFPIDEGQQLPGGLRVAAVDGGQDAGNFAHDTKDNLPAGKPQASEAPFAIARMRPRSASKVFTSL